LRQRLKYQLGVGDPNSFEFGEKSCRMVGSRGSGPPRKLLRRLASGNRELHAADRAEHFVALFAVACDMDDRSFFLQSPARMNGDICRRLLFMALAAGRETGSPFRPDLARGAANARR